MLFLVPFRKLMGPELLSAMAACLCVVLRIYPSDFLAAVNWHTNTPKLCFLRGISVFCLSFPVRLLKDHKHPSIYNYEDDACFSFARSFLVHL